MKVLKKILTILAGLVALLCGVILLCAMNPELSEKIGAVIPSKAEQTVQEEVGPEQDAGVMSVPTAPEEEAEDTGSGNSVLNVTTPMYIPIVEKNQDSADYEAPDESSIKVPPAVSGKGGYQPITEKSEELAGGVEYTSSLGYGETGDGLDFDAAFYPYYHMLDEKGKHLYRQIYANANALKNAFVPVEAIPVEKVKDVVEAVYNDHPELFWLNTAFSCKYDKDKICAELRIEFNELAEDLPAAKIKLGDAVNDILTRVQGFGAADDKERVIHDYLTEIITYDKGADMNQSVYSALVNRETVCAGYSRAMQYLLQKLGVPCYYCTGYAGENHAWNIVRLDDGYYNVDVTWDDTPEGEYDYFNKTDADFATTHLRKNLSVNLPPCNGQRYRTPAQTPGGEAVSGGISDKNLRSIADIGVPESEVKTTMQQYYEDCFDTMSQMGLGSYAFSNVIQGRQMYDDWYRAYQTDEYRQSFAERAMSVTGANNCHMEMQVEPLQGDRYLVTHSVRMN